MCQRKGLRKRRLEACNIGAVVPTSFFEGFTPSSFLHIPSSYVKRTGILFLSEQPDGTIKGSFTPD